jgi:hypothetical protein
MPFQSFGFNDIFLLLFITRFYLICIINGISCQTNQNLPRDHMSHKKHKNEENRKYIYIYINKEGVAKKKTLY